MDCRKDSRASALGRVFSQGFRADVPSGVFAHAFQIKSCGVPTQEPQTEFSIELTTIFHSKAPKRAATQFLPGRAFARIVRKVPPARFRRLSYPNEYHRKGFLSRHSTRFLAPHRCAIGTIPNWHRLPNARRDPRAARIGARAIRASRAAL